jgi:hypothetical protein
MARHASAVIACAVLHIFVSYTGQHDDAVKQDMFGGSMAADWQPQRIRPALVHTLRLQRQGDVMRRAERKRSGWQCSHRQQHECACRYLAWRWTTRRTMPKSPDASGERAATLYRLIGSATLNRSDELLALLVLVTYLRERRSGGRPGLLPSRLDLHHHALLPGIRIRIDRRIVDVGPLLPDLRA